MRPTNRSADNVAPNKNTIRKNFQSSFLLSRNLSEMKIDNTTSIAKANIPEKEINSEYKTGLNKKTANCIKLVFTFCE